MPHLLPTLDATSLAPVLLQLCHCHLDLAWAQSPPIFSLSSLWWHSRNWLEWLAHNDEVTSATQRLPVLCVSLTPSRRVDWRSYLSLWQWRASNDCCIIQHTFDCPQMKTRDIMKHPTSVQLIRHATSPQILCMLHSDCTCANKSLTRTIYCDTWYITLVNL